MTFDFNEFIKKRNQKQDQKSNQEVHSGFDFSQFKNDEVLSRSGFVLSTALMNLLIQKNLIEPEELESMIYQTVQALTESEEEFE